MNKFNYDYSEYSDILHIHKNGGLTKGSAELGDFTLDFGKNDEIVGVEIEHASEFFKEINIDKESLVKIQDAQFLVDKRNPRCELIFLKLKFPNIVKKIPLPLPIAA